MIKYTAEHVVLLLSPHFQCDRIQYLETLLYLELKLKPSSSGQLWRALKK